MDQVVVVGGGLAGVSACNTVVENGGKTVLIDKSSFCGGNSTKATSGINGADTKTQRAKGIEDSKELFVKDTLKGGAKRPEIAKVLCENSGDDVNWLMDAFDLDLSLVARLGGHSAPRTHRGKERFPGMTITYALIQMVEKIAETTDKARIITKARATELLQGPSKDVIGLIYEKGGQQFKEMGPVILCSGGFGADFSNNSLLAKYRPDLLHLPTTNGEHCTGDGIKMGEKIGAKTVDLEWVQVHPTGLVKPDDADAKIKFLAAEALRGVGGIILNKDGDRFANELGRRDYVTGEMWKNKPPFRLCLNNAASTEILWHCKHYTGRGVMKYYQSGADLAKEMGVPVQKLVDVHQQHYDAAKKTEKDPDGGSWPAYPSGKSWDAASGPTGSGKKFYHNIIPGSAVATEPFYVAIITPVIHYCMGGLEINAEGGVLNNAGGAIKGLYCAGEVAGGVHGNNRLGGNSLLDCVVFGRVTGKAAAKYYLGAKNVKQVNLKVLTQGQQVIVVGGGLAGVSCCNTVLENGGKTVLIDKSSFCGGNSTKATSGINGADTKTQRAKGIEDSKELFVKDTLKGGAKRPEIAKVLCENSGDDVNWLMDAFDLDLSLVARLGGHSAPRTHRGKERFPGMTITYALIQMVEKVAENSNKARIINKARAVELLQGSGKDVIGLIYEKDGQRIQEYGPVVLCSGGFGADFSSNSLLAKYRPDLLHLPTTNGEHCTGDGIKMGEAIGAKTVDLEWVQVHPTGLVKPDDADAKIKFLAAEALRGVGGLVLNKDGKRFANELGRRDYVTGEMWKNKPPFRLCLNNAASTEILWHCKHYTGRGVMKYYESGEALAKEMGIDVKVLVDTHQQHYDAAKKTEKDPDGGSWPAYPSGKSWDAASGPTGSGKKFYHNIIPGSAVPKEPFYVAIITPVIHYCMGGLEINAEGGVLDTSNRAIPGLYCAGEVAGGVHGNNRLGGNSLLDCVVFGRVTGIAATKYYLGAESMKKLSLKALSGDAQVIVVGGGLAGVSACNTIVENGGKTVLIDKSSFCGGNSTKATSGINGADTKTQRAKGIEDSKELFVKDTLKGGAKRPEIARVLCENSGDDVNWLMDVFNLDLSLVARLGGHSAPRTHRGKERFPGMTITYALIQMVEKISETTDKARIITKARANELIVGANKEVIGLKYEKGGQTFEERGPVILCSGGFGADFSSNSLLAKYRPDLLHLPTTNGEHCTGDGIKMGEAIGAKSVDLEWVQVHPTGLVKPDDADAKIKFLAAEALRGVGGLILNKEGKRFANELGRRDYVTGEMWKNKPPFRLCLNNAASTEILWHCKHYTGRGVMKYYGSGEELAKDMGVPVSVLEEVHQQHYDAAKKTEKDPDGGSWPAYPSGKSWDAASGPTGSGKKFYHNIIPGSAVKTEPFFVAIITPVIHYCMGGLEIDADGGVMHKDGTVIKGLYCAGEVAGGVHGNNRLGGNSLLDCVVFGRVTGKASVKYLMGDVSPVDLLKLTNGGLSGEVKASANCGGAYEDNMNAGTAVAKKAKAPKEKKAKSGGGGGGLDLAEVAKHTTKGDCWVVVNGDVINVGGFLGEHPGGELAILTFAGKDASEEFNMIHPPDVISKYAPSASFKIIGKLGEGGGGGADDDDDDDDDESEYEEVEESGGGGLDLAEVAKHTTKGDCWVVVNGDVINVGGFLGEHPGGELAILTFAGKDASEEFNMIHPPDVISKYAPSASFKIIGKLGQGGGGTKKLVKKKKEKGGAAVAAAAPAAKTGHGGRDYTKYLANKQKRMNEEGKIAGCFGALMYMVLGFMKEIIWTIFGQKNIILTNDRVGLTRSAMFLFVFIIIHAIGNLHVFLGPDDFNGYGYFYVRLYWSGFGMDANIVEEYVALCALLHVVVALKRTYDISLNMTVASGKLNLAFSGVCLLTFMTIHLFQFRFGVTQPYAICPPPYLVNLHLQTILSPEHPINLFWEPDCKFEDTVYVRDIYRLEFELFKSFGWCFFYGACVCVFATHMCLGWQKVVPAPSLDLPKRYHSKAIHVGYWMTAVIALIYISFPFYTHCWPMKPGNFLLEPPAPSLK